ncbi:glutathione S-transferase 1-1-like [Diachasmimorpha longicaudata]|uniref:glutathione S-transferase 1-1-like n=1 Tax=Diachasmimorpha longicaudata TaxID=58733 RepID=UPI0030B8BF84
MNIVKNFMVRQVLPVARTSPLQVRCYSKPARPILYTTEFSPACRAVLLAEKASGLDLDKREVNLMKGEHLKEEYLKLNPQHTVPTLDDNGHIICDSHAINCYLIDKYGKDDSLYPKDLKARSLVNQRLHFNSGILFASLRETVKFLMRPEVKSIPKEQQAKLMGMSEFLNKFLDGKKWLVGDSYTLADISCVATFSSIDHLIPMEPYPNIVRWLKDCENELPGYAEANAPGVAMLKGMFKLGS